MNIELTAIEARIIGSLMEKAITTPDQYPLSLNALTNACNQKSNRDPIMELDESTVRQSLDTLAYKHLVLDRSGFGSRVPKYQHRFCNTGFGSLTFTELEAAILCELLLRGPQTPGELRTRAARMAQVKEVNEVETALANLTARSEGPFVVRLPREANRRDSRYAHLLSGDIAVGERDSDEVGGGETVTTTSAASQTPHTDSSATRIEQLEQQVAQLRRELDDLKHQLREQRSDV